MQSKLFRYMIAIAFSFAFLFGLTAVGQVLKGSISGSVTDPQKAVLSGAHVKATDQATGATLTTTTDSSGTFHFNLIPAGTYKVEVSATGFKTTTQTGIPVSAGRDSGLGTIVLAVGDTSTTVEVVATSGLIESTQAQVTNTFTPETLTTFVGLQDNEGLDNIALFVPGVSSSRDNNFSNFNGGQGFSVNGIRGRNNDQQIDGQNNNDNSVAGPGLFVSDPEWVGQYVLITNQFGPEYGRNAGSVVNIITKSGTNKWHGSVYAAENNSVLNAMTNFQKNFDRDVNGNPLTEPPKLNDIFSGIQIGGPLVKNRVFVSGGFNNQIINTSNFFTSAGITPTPAGLAALTACFPSGPGAQSLAALKSFGPFAVTGGNPFPQNTTTGIVTACPNAEFGSVTRTLSTPAHFYDFYGRTDVQWTNDTVVGRYIYNRSNFLNNDDGAQGAAAGYPFNEPALAQSALASWTHNFSSRIVNEARVSYGRLNVEFGGNNIGNTVPTVGNLNQALTNVIFNNTQVNLGFGPNVAFPQNRIVNTWQGQDNLNYVVGKHQIKAGVNWTYQRTGNNFLPNLNGQFRFADWDAFFANTPDRVRVGNGPSNLDFREYDTFAYIGDDWKIRRNLTLNLGLTWTYYGQPANLFNDISTTRETNPATAFWSSTVPATGLNPGAPLPLSVRTNPRLDTQYNNFGPSAGFAFSPDWGMGPMGHGRTVIRGGYRMLFDPPFYNIYLNIAGSAPLVFAQTFSGATATGIPLLAVPTGPAVRQQLSPSLQRGVFDPRTFNQVTVAPNFRSDRVQSWSFGIEQQITKNSALEVRYAGNHANDLFQTVDGNPFIGDLAATFPNLVAPGLTPCPAALAFNPIAVGRANCNAGVVLQRTNSGFSNYQGVQAEFRANNMFKQLLLRMGYTYSKTLDNVSEIFSTFVAGNTLAVPQNPSVTQNGEYSFSGLDYPHTFSILVSEQLPFFKDQHGWAGHLLGGWVISANYLVQSGQRYTPIQISGIASATAAGDFYDAAFLNAFVGADSARPFIGNLGVTQTSVGIFAGDAGVGGNPNQLISFNALNANGSVVPVSKDQVRYIVNAATAQSIFGTPFGNMPRNIAQDDITNIGNLSVAKLIKIGERASFEFRASAVNVLNHPNYASIDPFVEDAGGTPRAPFFGFGDPTVSNNIPGVVSFPVGASRRLIFGGVVRF